ncbi:MAG: VacB/RNase II family 3'-5' exoribonuclease, partial [Bacteroidota bacterium]|nr:VacB/RNase II family 3'-5' exoribonuclease [Bacteroidota bacterium]
DFDRVVLEITDWKEKPGDRMMGRILQVLGAESSIDMEMKSILADKGFSLQFPRAVELEMDQLVEDVRDLDKRKDFRDVLTFTIDPIDAKDFDDALSVQKNENGLLEVGVHIADVSYYVKPDSALDKEALKRGNSVYLVDRVLPMLPEKLSNELCSLRPNEDKLTFSVVFTFNDDMEVIHYWIGRTIIHSDKRFSYEEAQIIMDSGKGIHYKELTQINRIAEFLREERLKNGAIDFESTEVRFRLDANLQPVELMVKERKPAHMLVEEFMLLANKYVAGYMAMKNKAIPIPFVYRIHDMPDPDKLEDFAIFAREMGVHLDFRTPKKISKSLNHLVEESRKNEDLKILQPLAIRTMAKAEYSIDNIGHYGLAFTNYAHFTSPIRRYADLLVHRILFENLHQEKRMKSNILEVQCRYISSQERKAMEAERESTKYFQILFMKKHVGERFDARITGMNERGFYIEIPKTMCEGILPFELLPDDYQLEKGRMSARSNQSDEVFKIGHKITVQLKVADLDDRELIFELPE